MYIYHPHAKILSFLFACVYVYVACEYSSHKEESVRFLELEKQVVVSRVTWVLGTTLGPPRKNSRPS